MSQKKLLIFGVIVLFAIGGYLAFHKTQGTITATTGRLNNRTAALLSKPAPDFSVQTIDGQQFSLAAHKGKPVILFAMFGGCDSCIPVGQTLNQVQSNFVSKGVTVIALDILQGEPTSVLEQYRSETKATFPLVSYDANVVNNYKLTAPEITYVIDKNGNVAFINQNALSYDQYKQQVEQAL